MQGREARILRLSPGAHPHLDRLGGGVVFHVRPGLTVTRHCARSVGPLLVAEGHEEDERQGEA